MRKIKSIKKSLIIIIGVFGIISLSVFILFFCFPNFIKKSPSKAPEETPINPPSPPINLPSPPTDLSITATSTQITLSWKAAIAGTYPIAGYEIYRSTKKGGPYEKISFSKTTKYTDKTLKVGITYYYTVCAVDINGYKSSYSLEKSARLKTISKKLKTISKKLFPFGKIYNFYEKNKNYLIYSIQQTSDGGYIIGGETYPTSFISGDVDAWIVKLNANFSIKWQKRYDLKNYWEKYWKEIYGKETPKDLRGTWEQIADIQQLPDGGYLAIGTIGPFEAAGGGTEDMWISKLDANGTMKWVKIYDSGEGSEGIFSFQKTIDGNYILLGNAGAHGAGTRPLVFKFNPNGNIIWQKAYGKKGLTNFSSLQPTPDKGYIVGGSYDIVKTNPDGSEEHITQPRILKLNPDGSIKWAKILNGIDSISFVQPTIEGGYIVSGHIGEYPKYNPVLIKLSSEGNIKWAKKYSYYDQNFSSLQQLSDGSYLATSISPWSEDKDTIGNFSILKLDSDGNIKWAKKYSDKNQNEELINSWSTQNYFISAIAVESHQSLRMFKIGLNGQSTPLGTDIKDEIKINTINITAEKYTQPITVDTTSAIVRSIIPGIYNTNAIIKIKQ